jgi:hypothetical protein
MIYAEDTVEQPTGFHYFVNRGGDSPTDRSGAEDSLARQGCTRVLHFASPGGTYQSFGYVEHVSVINQRMREPHFG